MYPSAHAVYKCLGEGVYMLPYLCVCVLSCSVVPDSCDPIDCSPPGSLCPRDSPVKDTGVGCHFLLQRIFPTQESNPSPALQADSLWTELQGFWLNRAVRAKLLQSWQVLCDPMDCIACQVPPSMEFSRQECWSGLPFPTRGNLPNSGIKPKSLRSPALVGGFFTTSTKWEALHKSTLSKWTMAEKEICKES